jgi:FlaA1/EpsC-like NDP-sugar epimerase
MGGQPDTGGRMLSAALLERDVTVVHGEVAEQMLHGRRVLVTGAAGSIGSELVRQLNQLGSDVYLLDLDESRLHALQLELTGGGLLEDPRVILADIRDERRVRQVMRDVRPDLVFHAAAHKHLPLLERYPSEGVKTNVEGTLNLAHAAVECGVERFILVSTDKAADPSSVLGATKRLAEEIVTGCSGLGTRFASVRFGNVLASRGSLIDTIRHQVANGLTISITDPHVERYFMTIPEAVGLVIEASAMARRGETYVLEMGEPIKIVDIVKRYAAHVGVATPSIEFVGLRDGEKLSEELFSNLESQERTSNPLIWRTRPAEPHENLHRVIDQLISAARDCDDETVRSALPRVEYTACRPESINAVVAA